MGRRYALSGCPAPYGPRKIGLCVVVLAATGLVNCLHYISQEACDNNENTAQTPARPVGPVTQTKPHHWMAECREPQTDSTSIRQQTVQATACRATFTTFRILRPQINSKQHQSPSIAALLRMCRVCGCMCCCRMPLSLALRCSCQLLFQAIKSPEGFLLSLIRGCLGREEGDSRHALICMA